MEVKRERVKFKESKIAQQNHIIEEICNNGSLQYNCTACGKTFRSRSQKYYHLRCNQLQQMLYKCDSCDKAFARHSQWKYHNQSHISPINKCHKCQKTFSNPLALRKHAALHKAEPKLCPHCDKSYLKKESLEQHIQAQHLNQLQYGCANCSKKYASKSSLQLHLQTHEKKRFECSFCKKSFYRNSVLNLHLKRHYNSKGYMCTVCHKVFSESGALSRHHKIHEENSIQYNCRICNKTISRKDNMNRHVNTIHPEEKFHNIVEVIKPSFTETNDSFEPKIEIERNKSFVIIENKLIQKPTINISGQNNTETETDVPCNINNEREVFGFQTRNQINVIMEVPSSDNNLLSLENKAADETILSDSKPQEYKASVNILRNESNNKSKDFEGEYENQTEKMLTPVKEIQSFCQPIVMKDKLSYVEERLSNSNVSELENLRPKKTQDDVQMQNDFESKTQTISSVIRSIGNVKKNVYTCNITGNTKTIDKTNSEYIHKKYCRNNYNIDLYRKILGCDDDDNDDQQQESNNCAPPNHLCNNIENNTLKYSGPVHWRKSFKNNYETSASCDG